MESREAYRLITQLEQELAQEPDPETRTWYRVESELQPEMVEARGIVIRDIASLIGQVIDKKSEDTTPLEFAEPSNEGLDPADIPEAPKLLTASEVLWNRIDRKYDRLFSEYQDELRDASTLKKSKREFRDKLARRQFARQFNDFSDLTSDANIVLQAELMGAIVEETVLDEGLRQAIFENAAEFAQKNALEVTKDPKNFAFILASSVSDRPLKGQFESILRGIFGADSSEMPELHTNLAYAALELLGDFEALKLVAEIAYLKKTYVPATFHSERLKGDAINADRSNYSTVAETNQANSIFKCINEDITGVNYSISGDQSAVVVQHVETAIVGILPDSAHVTEEGELSGIPESGTDLDPVAIKDLDGNSVDLGVEPMTPLMREVLGKSELFQQRMQKLSPYSYSVRAARNLLKTEGIQGMRGLSMPLSPKVAIDVYFPVPANGPPVPIELEAVSERFGNLHNEVLTHAVNAESLGVCNFEDSGSVGMFFQPLFEDDLRRGVIIYRPAIAMDKNKHNPLQQLAINYATVREKILRVGDLEEFADNKLEEENVAFREEIKKEQKRFLGRRPIKFAMPLEMRQMTGLTDVSLRYNPREHDIKCVVTLDDGEVELTLNRDYQADDSGKISIAYPGMRQYYENLILKLVKQWACANEVHTSEGVVSESSGHTANMGHFAYLRIREDGRRYNFSETQQAACAEEQGKDLAAESERLKHLDPSGNMRNSTYVREFYDPDKPPLVVYATMD